MDEYECQEVSVCQKASCLCQFSTAKMFMVRNGSSPVDCVCSISCNRSCRTKQRQADCKLRSNCVPAPGLVLENIIFQYGH